MVGWMGGKQKQDFEMSAPISLLFQNEPKPQALQPYSLVS